MKKINIPFINSFMDKFFGSNAIVRPKRDWAILLIFFFLLLLGAMAYDGFLYRDIASGEMYVSVNPNEIQSESIDATTLNSVVADFESRQAEIATMKIQKLVDPSL